MGMKLDLENVFSHHSPFGDQLQRYAAIRAAAKEFAKLIADTTPDSAEQTLALRKLQEAMMFANAAIAINEKASP
jgi:hypothetical protein